MLRNYIKTTLRTIKKQKVYAFINIFGLAVGMACCIQILLWIQHEMSFDRFHRNFKSIHRIVADWPKNDWNGVDATPQPLGPLVKEQIPEVQETVRIASHNRKIFRYLDRAFYESRGLMADPSLFKVFSFRFLEGNPETAFSAPSDLVITESLARKYFGEKNPMGKTLEVEGKHARVTGIIADIPINSTLRFDFVSSFEFIRELSNHGVHWGAFNFSTFVWLHVEADPAAVGQKITGIALKNRCPQVKSGAFFRLQPLSQVHLDTRNYQREIVALGDRGSVYLFSVIAVFVLLIACVNFMNLATARSSLRVKEIGLRKTVGAGRGQLFRQFLGESIIMTSLAFSAALGLVLLLLPAFNRLSGKQMSLNLTQTGHLIGLAALFLITGFLAGGYPAVFLSGLSPSFTLKGGRHKKDGGIVLRRILVVFQFSLTIILLIGTVVIYRQLHFVSHADLGFDRENIVQVPVKENIAAQYNSFKSELLKSPYVLSVTAERYPFAEMTWRSASNFDWEGREGRENLDMVYCGVDYDFFNTMSLDMVEGRPFSKEHPSDAKSAVILNEEAVRAMGIVEPIGKWFSASREDKFSIIGVVQNAQFRSMHFSIEPRLFYIVDMSEAGDQGLVLVKVQGDNVPIALAGIRQTWEKFNPVSPFEYHFMDETYAELYRREQRMFKMFNIFSGVAILISCLGLFGLAAFMAERRTKEIGIRKVLGAGESKIVFSLTMDFVRWVLLANVFAWPVGFFLSKKLLQNFAFRISFGWGLFLWVGLTTVLIAGLTVSLQAFKAARTSPVEALRYE